MTDNFLIIRATIVNSFILDFSKMIIQELSLHLKQKGRISKHIKIDVDKLPKEKRIKIVFIVAYTLLYNAQRFFGENIIRDEENSLKFEQYLYEEFAKTSQIDPIPYINDYLEYVKKIGDSGETQYIGSKICDEINIKDGFLMLDIINIYSSFLINSFYQQLKKLWNISDQEIETLLA